MHRSHVACLAGLRRVNGAAARSRFPSKVPRDLETVCLKCLHKEPRQRYAAAQDLADELERFLKDEPIRAKPPTLGQRARKWARRHRTAVRAAVVVLVLMAAGSATSAGLIYREFRAKVAALGLAKQEEDNAKTALREKAEESEGAQGNLRLALEVMEKKYLKVAEQRWLRDPQREEEDRRDLDDLLGFYEQFAERNRGDPELRKETAHAYLRVGHIRDVLHEHRKAQEAYETAITLFARLREDYPEEPSHRWRLARAHWYLGRLFLETGRARDAVGPKETARSLLEQLVEEYRDVRAYREELVQCHLNRGDWFLAFGEYEQAAKAFRRAVELAQPPGDALPELRRHFVAAATALGGVLDSQGQLRKAEEALLQARDQAESLFRAAGGDANNRVALASVEDKPGQLLDRLGYLDDAIRAMSRAVQLYEEVETVHGNVPEYWSKRATFSYNLAIVLSDAGPYEEAQTVRHRAEAFLVNERRLADRYPDVPKYQANVAGNYNSVGIELSKSGQFTAAEEAYRKAIDVYAKLAERFKEEPLYRDRQALCLSNRGNALRQHGRLADAEKDLREALRLRRELVARYPQAPDYRAQLALNLLNLGGVLSTSDQLKEAEDLYQEVVDPFERRDANFPLALPSYRRDVATSYANLASIYYFTDRIAEAGPFLDRALVLARELVRQAPRVPDHQNLLGLVLHNRAGFERSRGDSAEACRLLREAIDHTEKAVQLARGNPEYHQLLLGHWGALAQYLGERKEAGAAEAVFARFIALHEELLHRYPELPNDQQSLAVNRTHFADLLKTGGKFKEAVPLFEQAREVFIELAGKPTPKTKDLVFLAAIHQRLAQCYTALKQIPEAAQSWRDDAGVLEKLRAANPEEPLYRDQCATAYNEWGLVLVFNGRVEEAEAPLRRARDLRKALADEFPEELKYWEYLAASVNNLGILEEYRGNRKAAAEHYQKAAEALKSLPALSAGGRNGLGNAMFNQAKLLNKPGDWPRARDLLTEAIDNQRAALKAEPENLVLGSGNRGAIRSQRASETKGFAIAVPPSKPP